MKNSAALRFLSRVSGRMKLGILGLLLVNILLGASSVLYALQLRAIVDAAVAHGRPAFFQATAQFVLLVLAQLLLRAAARFLEELTRSGLENRFKSRLFDRLLRADYASVTALHSGEWLNRLTSDTTVIANGMTDILPGVMGMAVKLVAAVIVLLTLEPRFLYLVVPGGVLMLLFSTAFRKKMKELHRIIRERDGKLRIFMQETLGSLLVVRSYAVESDASARAAQHMADHRAARMRRNHFSNFCNLGFGAFMNGAYVLGAIFCGYGILTQTMSYGTFTAVLQLISQIQSPFANISGYLPRYYAMIASAERLMEAEALASTDAPRRPLAEVQADYVRSLRAFGLSHASFTYLPPAQDLRDLPGKEQMPVVLSGLDLEIEKGSYVAFTGPSGCGKSTVLKLLMGLYHLDSGDRYLVLGDGTEPLDAAWQKLFAYVPQGNHLMSGTIRQIVAFADPAAMHDEARLRAALTIACADAFVDELAEGADTVLGERGAGLSEGQMQRLAIARAIFSAHPILMLDECTSALDEATEQALLSNLRAMTDKTVLIVTHRPAVLAICDQVVTFREGGCQVERTKKIDLPGDPSKVV